MQGKHVRYTCITDKLKEEGFVSTKNLSDWQEQQLQDAVRKGEAVRLKNGIYADIDALANTMVDIRMIVPGGILCLWSAWSVYSLTTQIPNAYYIAIERTRKIVLPDYPEFQLVYQSNNLLSIGVTRKNVQGYDIPIFDMERSVCDAIKYRNKLDSVPKSVYSPSFFIFANLLIFNKIILILKNYKLGTCKYLHFAPPFP